MFLNPFCHAQDTSMKTLVLLTWQGLANTAQRNFSL
jgi:hypothetical protein